jgi:predicted anti-sigma-YlaC factor YlaD
VARPDVHFGLVPTLKKLQVNLQLEDDGHRTRALGDGGAMRAARMRLLGMAIAMALLSGGCSVQRMAVNMIGDAMAEGNSVFETDDDLVLVGEALPFSLKLLEILLQESPDHEGLLLSACQGFVTYSFVYVQPEAERLEYTDFYQARDVRERARRLYLRASRYGLHGLSVALDGDAAELTRDADALLARAKPEHVRLLYWNAVALGLVIGVSKGDAAMLARLPEVEALLERALALDEGWHAGALHEFAITLAAAKPTASPADELNRHYQRALELSHGGRSGLFVSYAEALAVPAQDLDRFRELLDRALAVDPDADESNRLINLVAQQRARWLLDHVDDLFVIAEDKGDI